MTDVTPVATSGTCADVPDRKAPRPNHAIAVMSAPSDVKTIAIRERDAQSLPPGNQASS